MTNLNGTAPRTMPVEAPGAHRMAIEAVRESVDDAVVVTSPVITIDADHLTDAESFHDVFARAFGFPGFYGRNMNAWVDCMTSLDAPDDGMTSVHAPPGGVVTLVLTHAEPFKRRCPELYADLIECAAFVNWRRIERGDPAVLALAF